MTATATARGGRFPTWVIGVLPIVLIGALVGVFLAFDPIASLREVPPVEALAFERTVFDEDSIQVSIRNDGPDPVTIAQVLVNESYWDFDIGDPTLGRLESTDVQIGYPWDDGLPVTIGFVTETGLVIEHEVEAAALTPEADASTLGIYALLGIYIGVIPIAVGLLWFSSLRRINRRWLSFFLAFTVGLLAFLLLDTFSEGVELASEAPAALDGLSLFALGAVGAVLALNSLQAFLDAKAGDTRSGLTLAYLIAAGIGLHNLGEGLAVGAALAAGEIALGTFLVLGFALHNTTEGLAIVAPLGRESERPAMRHFVFLGALAGVPTILGAWSGGFSFSASWGALAFGVAAGAIAQVIWQISRSMPRDHRLTSGLTAAGLMVGLVFMYLTGLLTA